MSIVLIAASGPRCGSTLLQRVLSSSRELFVWGEHNAFLRRLNAIVRDASSWDKQHGQQSRQEFKALGLNSFMANLAPPEDVVRLAARQFVEQCFARNLPWDDCHRWGVKEIRYLAKDCADIQSLLGPLQIVHLTRRPEDVAVSLDAWERELGAWTARDSRRAFQLWDAVNRSFRRVEVERLGLHALTITYEGLVESPRETLSEVCSHIALDASALDYGLLDRRVHASGDWGQRSRDLRRFQELPVEVRETCDRLLHGPSGWPWQS